MNATATPLRYKGHNNWYVDIGVRNDEHLGIAMEYEIHPVLKVGCFILRFVVHGKGVDPKNYKHLTYREPASFKIPGTETTSAQYINGVRLNKLALPVFNPPVFKHEAAAFCDTFNVWALLTEWVTEQVTTEGFILTVTNLGEELRGMVAVPHTTDPTAIKCVLEFPDLAAAESQKAALKLVKSPAPDEDDEDEDGDDDDKAEWLN